MYNPPVLPEVQAGRFLSPDQFLLTTLIVKLAVMAVLATMVARYRRFRHILIFERRGWLDRMVFMLAMGMRNVAYNTLTSKVPRAEERARFMSILSAVQHAAGASGAR